MRALRVGVIEYVERKKKIGLPAVVGGGGGGGGTTVIFSFFLLDGDRIKHAGR